MVVIYEVSVITLLLVGMEIHVVVLEGLEWWVIE